MCIIDIRNLNFKYGENKIFNNFNLKIKEATYNNIIGLNGSGKSTLIRIILGLLKFDGEITIDNKILNKVNIKEIKKQIGVVFGDFDEQFVAKTVMDDIAFSLENLNLKPKNIKIKVEEISNHIGISHLLECNPNYLNSSEKQLVALASALVHEPKILILDGALTMVDVTIKKRIYKFLEDTCRNKNMTIINITNNMDDIVYGDNIIIMDNGNIILNGPKEEVLLEEKVFNKLNLELPFMINLSIKLKYYGLIDRLIFDMNEMVDEIWK